MIRSQYSDGGESQGGAGRWQQRLADVGVGRSGLRALELPLFPCSQRDIDGPSPGLPDDDESGAPSPVLRLRDLAKRTMNLAESLLRGYE